MMNTTRCTNATARFKLEERGLLAMTAPSALALNFIAKFTLGVISALIACVTSPRVHASNTLWSHHASEAEVSALVRDLLIRAELPAQEIKRGAYPLFGDVTAPHAVIPLLSFSCPLLLSCDALVQRLRSELITRGYRLVYSDQSPLKGRPMHFAIARGKRPVMALRLNPSPTSMTLLLHLTPKISSYIALLDQLSPHITLTFHPELLESRPDQLRALIESGREHFIRVDEMMIKRALLDSETGELIAESAARRAQFGARLSDLFLRVPSALGVYLDYTATFALDRALADELIAQCAAQHRVIVTADESDGLLNALALAYGVRSAQVKSVTRPLSDLNALTNHLKGVAATLVIEGDIALGLRLPSVRALRALKEWTERLAQREVTILRVSERAR